MQHTMIDSLVRSIDNSVRSDNAKGALFQLSQKLAVAVPTYTVTPTGPAHRPQWAVDMTWRGYHYHDVATTRREAESAVSMRAFDEYNGALSSFILIADAETAATTALLATVRGATCVILNKPNCYRISCEAIASTMGTTTTVIETCDAKKILLLATIATSFLQSMSDKQIPPLPIYISSTFAVNIVEVLRANFPHQQIIAMSVAQ